MADEQNDMIEIGQTGLKQHGGIVREEFLRELIGTRGTKTYREMRDNDPVVGAILFAIDMLIRNVTWRVEPASEDQGHMDDAQFVTECMEDMSNTWEDTISEIMSLLPFGFSYHEVVYKKRGGDSEDPSQRSAYDDGRIGWRKLAPRAQETKTRWEIDDNGGIQGMYQRISSGQEVFIPIGRALLFRANTAKNNPEGRSILRSAYRPWYFKKQIEEIEGIGIERDLAGLPVAYVPAKIMSASATANDKAVFNAIKDIVRNIRRDEQEGVVFPGDTDESGNKLYELELLSTGGSRQFDTSAIITRYDQRIAMTVLADFIMLGHEKVGSFALSSSKTDLFATAMGAWLKSIKAVFNRHAIPRLFRVNGMQTEEMPELNFGDIESVNLKELSEYIKNLTASGMELFPDDALENILREHGDLPPKIIEE